jgi:DHA1 family multidrug resistance protein-like MFS transporter
LLSKAKIYSGPILVLGVVQLIESLAFSIPLSYFPNYVIGLGASVASLGLFTSSFMIASAIMSPKIGSYSDLYGRKKIMIAGIIGDIILGALMGLAPSWYWLLLIRVVDGVVSSAAMLSAEALLMDSVSPHRRGEATGFVMSMGMIGRNIGPLFGGAVQSLAYSSGLTLVDSYRIPYFIDSAMAVLVLLLVMWKIQDIEVDNSATTTRVRSMPSSDTVKVPMSFSFKILLFYGFMNGMGVGFLMPVMALFYNDKFGIEPLEIGLILSISGFIGFLASWVAGRLSDRIGRKPLIAIGSFLSRICGFALPLTRDVIQASVFLSARSLGSNINMPAMRALRADLSPAEARGKFFGMFRAAFRAGDIVGPLIGTYLYDIYRFKNFELGGLVLPGYGIPFFINSILGIAATIVLLVLVKEVAHNARINL